MEKLLVSVHESNLVVRSVYDKQLDCFGCHVADHSDDRGTMQVQLRWGREVLGPVTYPKAISALLRAGSREVTATYVDLV